MPVSESADSLEDYKEKRRQAEHDPDRVRPYLSSDASLGGRSRLKAQVELFKEGYNSLDDVNGILSKDDFHEFIQVLVKDIPGVHPELVDIIDPGRELFGVEHTQPSAEAWNEGQIKMRKFDSPFRFLEYKPPSRDQITLWRHDAKPWEKLDCAEPESTPRIVEGDLTADDLNRKLAEIISDKDYLTLPKEYQHLLE
jgi:hypothetical protein